MLLGFASIIIGYLLGSFPAAYIIAKQRKGIDIREVGVRNMGSGNVKREVGLWEGFVVLIADVAKGAGAILVAQALGVPQPWVLWEPALPLCWATTFPSTSASGADRA